MAVEPRDAEQKPEDVAAAARREDGQDLRSAVQLLRQDRHAAVAGLPRPDDEHPLAIMAEFSRRCVGVRVDYRLTQDGIDAVEVMRVAYRVPQEASERQIEPGSPAGKRFEEALLDLWTAAATQVTAGVVGAPTRLDTLADSATMVLEPEVIAAKIGNVAVQAVAHHAGLGSFASLLGQLAEKQVTQWLDSSDGLARGVNVMQGVTVSLDVADGRFSPDVRDFVADKLGDKAVELATDKPGTDAVSEPEPPRALPEAPNPAVPLVLLDDDSDRGILPGPGQPSPRLPRPSAPEQPSPPDDDPLPPEPHCLGRL